MSDTIDAELEAEFAALEKAAPLTADPEEIGDPEHYESETEGAEQVAGSDATPGDELAKSADPAKPPLSREEVEKRLDDQKKATREARERARKAEDALWQLQNGGGQQQAPQQTVPQGQPQAQHQAPVNFAPGYDPAKDPRPTRNQFQTDGEFAQAEYDWLYRQNEWRAQAENAQREQQTQQAQISQQQQAVVRHLASRVSDFEAEFKETTPDYDQAIDFLAEIRTKYHMGRGFDEGTAKQMVVRDFLSDAAAMMDNRVNPAEAAYNLAKQFGYGTQATDAQTAQQQDTSRIEQIKQGQGAAKSLSGGGKSPSGSMSLKAITSLEGDDFDKAADRFLRR